MKNFVTGIRHPPHSWKFWNLDLLENDQIKSLQDDRAHQLKCEFKIILISLYVRFGLKMHFEIWKKYFLSDATVAIFQVGITMLESNMKL